MPAQVSVLFAGIDLAMSPRRPSAFAVLSGCLESFCLYLLRTDSDILAAVDLHRPLIVAIDSPLGLPRGLCCLEEDCSCYPESEAKGRVCERELARRGIPCYYTTKRSIIKEMVYRAMSLKDELCARGYRVIEVYPYASKVQLFGRPIPKKTTAEGLEVLREHLIGLIPSLGQHRERLNHDLCDALVAAYTAYLWAEGRARPLGVADEFQICVPG